METKFEPASEQLQGEKTYKIDLVGILVGAVLGHQAEEGILGGLRDDLSREDGGSGRRHVAGNVLDSGER